MGNILLFHIGVGKTGSTSLQHFLFSNSEILKKYGWIYPDFSTIVESSQFSWKNGFYLRCSSFEKYRCRMWDIISDNLKEHNVLISEEGFWADDISLLLSEAKKMNDNIKVIVYLRRQDQYICSHYNQTVKTTFLHSTVKEYQANVLNHKEDYLYNLEKIGHLIGDENIIVRVYEKQQFLGSRKDVLSDFMCTILGVEPNWDEWQIPERENSSLYGNFFEIKKLLNSVDADQMKLWPMEYLDIFMQLSKKYGNSYENAKKEGYLTRQERLAILNAHKENNTKIARKYLHRDNGQLFYDTNVDMPVYEEKATSFEADMIRMFSVLFYKLQSKIELLPLVTAIKMLRKDRKLAFYGVGERGKILLD